MDRVQTVPGADSVDPTTFTMTDTTQCDANTQPTGDQCGTCALYTLILVNLSVAARTIFSPVCVVQCPPGTYFNSTAQLCLNCAVGSYQDQPMQAQCKPCDIGMTTQKDGTVSSSDCFSMLIDCL